MRRRDCVQAHLYGAMGLDTLREYYVLGCDAPVLADFEGWAEATGCGREPLEGPLLIHTAWSGPMGKVEEDFVALFDSFLATQDTAQTKFVFWLIDTDPDPAQRLQRRYGGVRNGAIEFRRANLVDFVEGTALAGRDEFLKLDWDSFKDNKGPRWKVAAPPSVSPLPSVGRWAAPSPHPRPTFLGCSSCTAWAVSGWTRTPCCSGISDPCSSSRGSLPQN